MRVLLAFDKFKDSLTAQAAGEAAATALREQHPGWELDLSPLADGGEGFARILTESAGGRLVSHWVGGPLGVQVEAAYGVVAVKNIPAAARVQLQLPENGKPDDFVAVIEMAAASGLALLAAGERNPWQTTSLGTGELMRQAAGSGAVAILLGVGGSATNDLGLGALAALGFKFHSAGGEDVLSPIPALWTKVAGITGAIEPPLPPVFIACDVTNPLLGKRGAAAVYGPQKGLKREDHSRLEEESRRLAQLLCSHCHRPVALMETPGAGAAGGIAFGLMVAVGATLLPGFDLVSSWLDLENKLFAADIVITGEGRFDASSLEGKGPGAVAARALALGKPVHVFAGQVSETARPGLELHAITPAGISLPQALREAPLNLTATVRRVFTS